MNLFDVAGHLARQVLALAACVALVACGPGTGGTGTGPVNGVLTFTGGVGPSFSAPAASPCVADCAQATLRLEVARVELAAPCLRFTHAGAWTVDAAGLAVVQGTVETAGTAGTRTQLATLRLQFTEAPDDSRQVTLVLLDSDGRALLAPQTLDRRDGVVAPGASACGN